MRNLLLLVVLFVSMTALIAQETKSAEEFINEGNTAYREKNWEAAFNAFSSAIEIKEKEGLTDTALFYNAAYCAYQNNQFESSIRLFDKAIALGYKADKGYVFVANGYKKLNKEDQYEATVLKAFEVFPQDPRIRKMYATIVYKEGLVIYNDASYLIQKAAAVPDTKSEEFLTLKSQAEEKYKAALPVLEKAFNLDPKLSNLPQALKGVYEGLEMKEKAAEMGKIIEGAK
jgi:tetratricopeptide (TPR) repeat protein